MNKDLINQYILFLIKQYYEKPKANAEIKLLLDEWQNISNFIKDFGYNFDIDTAQDDALDLIGRIIGLPRQVNDVVPISYFGFSINPNAKSFGSINNELRAGGTFFSVSDRVYSPYQLNNAEYRKFLKVKAAKNTCSPYLVSDNKTSLQQVVFNAFSGNAYIVDGKDQTLNLYVSPVVDADELRLLVKLDILPRPITFRYKIVMFVEPGLTFGFSNNPGSKGFGSINNPLRTGGIFARFYNE